MTGVIGFGRRARSTNGTSVVRARLLLAVLTNEPFLRCVGEPSRNDSLSPEVKSLTSFQSREPHEPVRPGSALCCGKTCVLARGTTQSSTWYGTCIDEKPSVAWLARQATTGAGKDKNMKPKVSFHLDSNVAPRHRRADLERLASTVHQRRGLYNKSAVEAWQTLSTTLFQRPISQIGTCPNFAGEWMGRRIEYENQMQFSNRVVKGQAGPKAVTAGCCCTWAA